MDLSKRWLVRILLPVLLALVLGLAGGACSTASGPTPEEIAAQEAAEREAAEKARQEAEARRLAEERRQQQELMETFGPVGEPPPFALPPEERRQAAAPTPPTGEGAATAAAGAAPPAQESGAPYIPHGTTTGTVRIDLSRTGPAMRGSVPFDEAVPALPPDPVVRIAIFSTAGQWHKARETALSLSTYEREALEERMGKGVRIAYVAESQRRPRYPSEVHYRDAQFLHAAQAVASALAARQWVGPMTPEELQQEVDLVIYLGPGYR